MGWSCGVVRGWNGACWFVVGPRVPMARFLSFFFRLFLFLCKVGSLTSIFYVLYFNT